MILLFSSTIIKDKSITNTKNKIVCHSNSKSIPKDPTNKNKTRPTMNTNTISSDTKQTKVKYKIVNIPRSNPDILLEDLKAGNPSINFLDVENVYTVTDNNSINFR